jgi:hypothetical protein
MAGDEYQKAISDIDGRDAAEAAGELIWKSLNHRITSWPCALY